MNEKLIIKKGNESITLLDEETSRLYLNQKVDNEVLSEVAKSGSYTDLKDKPDISLLNNIETTTILITYDDDSTETLTLYKPIN